MPKRLPEFDKYFCYLNSVQAPDEDVEFFDQAYRESRGSRKRPTIFREDFCGTFMLSCSWVKSGTDRVAYGIDIDTEPLAYGQKNYLTKLTTEQRKRVNLLEMDVLSEQIPKADIIGALNFSYFCFKERDVLKKYLQNAYRSLREDGIMIMDCFGGRATMEPNEDETEYDDFTYYWDQDTFNPVTHHSQFYIHFKRKGEKRRERVFSYDWRMWTLPELQDLLKEVGFQRVHVYWEGDGDDGEGNGEFTRTTVGDDSEAWIAYLVSEK